MIELPTKKQAEAKEAEKKAELDRYLKMFDSSHTFQKWTYDLSTFEVLTLRDYLSRSVAYFRIYFTTDGFMKNRIFPSELEAENQAHYAKLGRIEDLEKELQFLKNLKD